MLRRESVPHRLYVAALVIVVSTLFSSSVMAQSAKVLELDHVSLCGPDLDALRQMFTDVGMTPDFGGPHGNGVTQMALIGFEDQSYLELIGPVKAGVTDGSDWAKFMSSDVGACAWAVGTNVLLQDIDRLKKAGIAVGAPQRGSRKRPDGMSLEWLTAEVGPGTTGSVLPFMIEDQTPRQWRVQPSASMNGAPVFGIENVIVGVNDLNAAIALFRKAYGWAEPLTETQKDFGKLAYFPGEPVILAAPSGGGWLADRVSKFGESPVAYLLATRDFAAASKKYKLVNTKTWFGQKVAWIDPGRIKGARVGVIGQ
ncbi:MAG: VOC family protein [Acidobacteria bacterium]|nr:VOC family protein [Acidobacteriota bacterium]